jgi:hypothetical protein
MRCYDKRSNTAFATRLRPIESQRQPSAMKQQTLRRNGVATDTRSRLLAR